MKLSPELKSAVIAAGQEHLLEYDSPLLEEQLKAIDWQALPGLAAEYVLKKPRVTIPDDVKPAPYFPLTPRTEDEKQRQEAARKRGEELLRQGKVACLTVAGGQEIGRASCRERVYSGV